MAIFSSIGLALGAAAGAATVTGLAVTAAAVGGIMKYAGAKRAQSAQQDQVEASTAISNEERRKSVRSNIRQAQVTRARAIMSAQGAGSFGSSGASGGIGAVGSNLGSALGSSSMIAGLQADYTAAGGRVAKAQALSNIGSSLFSAGVKSGGLDFLFPAQNAGLSPYASLDYREGS